MPHKPPTRLHLPRSPRSPLTRSPSTTHRPLHPHYTNQKNVEPHGPKPAPRNSVPDPSIPLPPHLPPPLTAPQRAYTQRIFTPITTSPRLLTSVPRFRLLPAARGLSEVAFLGRANVGKSSLLNALLGRARLAHTSKKAGRTRGLNVYAVGDVDVREGGRVWVGMGGGGAGFAVVDVPGYGKGSRREWGEEVVKYLRGRRG